MHSGLINVWRGGSCKSIRKCVRVHKRNLRTSTLCENQESLVILTDSSAFSNLTADGQYASLGLTLLGCLAKAQSLIRPFSKIQDITVPDPIALIQKTTIAATNEDDLGEVVSREAVDPAIVDTLEDQHSTASGQDNQFYHVAEKRRKNDQKSVNVSNMQELGPASNPNAKKKSKKKRKRGDEFDDLFSTLL